MAPKVVKNKVISTSRRWAESPNISGLVEENLGKNHINVAISMTCRVS